MFQGEAVYLEFLKSNTKAFFNNKEYIIKSKDLNTIKKTLLKLIGEQNG